MRASRSGALAPVVVLSLPHASRLQLAARLDQCWCKRIETDLSLSSEASTALHQMLQKHQAKSQKKE